MSKKRHKSAKVLHTRRNRGPEYQCLDCNGSEVSDGLVSLVTAWPSFVKPGLDGNRLRAVTGANFVTMAAQEENCESLKPKKVGSFT